MATRRPKMARELIREKEMAANEDQIKYLEAENDHLKALCKELEKQRNEAENRCDMLLEERNNLIMKLKQSKKPWWKKVLNCG